MSEAVTNAKADPELIRQLDAPTASNEPIAAVVRLQPDDPSEIVPSPERTEVLTQQILKRVKKRVGRGESRYNVFKNLGSFVVSAEPDFLRELISQPEVAAAVANVQPGGVVIPPVEKGRISKPARHKKSRAKMIVKRSSTTPKSAK